MKLACFITKLVTENLFNICSSENFPNSINGSDTYVPSIRISIWEEKCSGFRCFDSWPNKISTSYRSTTVLYAVCPLNYYIIYRGLCIVSINGSLPDERSIRVNFIKRNATASAVRYVSSRLLGHPSAYACAASFKATPSPRWTGGTATPNTPRPRRNEEQRKFTGHLVFHSLSVLSSSPSNPVRVGRCVPIMDSVTLPTKLRSICCVTFRPPARRPTSIHPHLRPPRTSFLTPALYPWNVTSHRDAPHS